MDVKTSGQCSQVAKQNLINREGGPSITCNWARFVFLHYEVEPALLQPDIPYALHLFEHKAYISLVAFTMEQFRFSKGGVFAKWLTAPIPTHQYFNIRTYVQHGGDNGIYFINEWISHLLCSITGSIMYGLPCHYGKLHYQYDDHLRQFSGRLIPANMRGAYDYQAEGDPQKQCEHVKKDSLDEFLLERYIAFVKSYGKKKYFRICLSWSEKFCFPFRHW